MSRRTMLRSSSTRQVQSQYFDLDERVVHWERDWIDSSLPTMKNQVVQPADGNVSSSASKDATPQPGLTANASSANGSNGSVANGAGGANGHGNSGASAKPNEQEQSEDIAAKVASLANKTVGYKVRAWLVRDDIDWSPEADGPPFDYIRFKKVTPKTQPVQQKTENSLSAADIRGAVGDAGGGIAGYTSSKPKDEREQESEPVKKSEDAEMAENTQDPQPAVAEAASEPAAETAAPEQATESAVPESTAEQEQPATKSEPATDAPSVIPEESAPAADTTAAAAEPQAEEQVAAQAETKVEQAEDAMDVS